MMRESAQERNWDLMLARLLTFFFIHFPHRQFLSSFSCSISFLPFLSYYTCIRDFYYMMIFFFYISSSCLPNSFSLSCCSCRARHSFIHFSFRLENIEYVSWAWDGETCVVVEPPTLRWLFKFCLLRSLCVVFFSVLSYELCLRSVSVLSSCSTTARLVLRREAKEWRNNIIWKEKLFNFRAANLSG